MRFSISSKPSRSRSSQAVTWFPEASTHPDLPLPPRSSSKTPSPRPTTTAFSRSASVHDRAYHDQAVIRDRRSLAIIPGNNAEIPTTHSSEELALPSPNPPPTGIARSQTVVRKESGSGRHYFIDDYNPSFDSTSGFSPPTVPWSQEHSNQDSPASNTSYSRATTLSAHQEVEDTEEGMPLGSSQYSAGNAPGKASSESTQQPGLDRWSQRRLQRLNTEQDFRSLRQNGAPSGILSPIEPVAGVYNTNNASQYASNDAQPHSSLHNAAQPHPSQQVAYQASRTGQANQPPLSIPNQTSQSTTNTLRSPNYTSAHEAAAHVPPQQPQPQHQHHQYPPQDAGPNNSATQESGRPSLAQTRSFTAADDDASMSGNGSLSAPKARSNRQSVHNGMTTLANSQPTSATQNSAQTASHKNGQLQQGQQSDVGRGTPQLSQSEEMTDEDVAQLIRDHKELRDKYTKVKKYYFEKEDQVKQLQNSLAHQRLSQSRTSLDDSEYTTRFNRLDGLVAQLAFSIRKEWKTMPTWLLGSINKDAIQVGKQEMTAAGRAFISSWLVKEFFDKVFHPDLDSALSLQLRTVQANIRRFATATQTNEEEEYLTSKTVNWRLATLEGLQDALRAPQCADNRQQLTNTIKDKLVAAVSQHMGGEAPPDLEGGVHMIVELVVSIAIHLPLESRDVVIEYFSPGQPIVADQMKTETGCPPLLVSFTDDAAERASLKSAASDITDHTEGGSADPSKKRSMLSAITGSSGKSKSSAQGKHAGAAGSSSSLNRPESSHGKEDTTPRVRMAAGIGVSVRGRSVLVKAPVFAV